MQKDGLIGQLNGKIADLEFQNNDLKAEQVASSDGLYSVSVNDFPRELMATSNLNNWEFAILLASWMNEHLKALNVDEDFQEDCKFKYLLYFQNKFIIYSCEI